MRKLRPERVTYQRGDTQLFLALVLFLMLILGGGRTCCTLYLSIHLGENEIKQRTLRYTERQKRCRIGRSGAGCEAGYACSQSMAGK